MLSKLLKQIDASIVFVQMIHSEIVHKTLLKTILFFLHSESLETLKQVFTTKFKYFGNPEPHLIKLWF